jgi:TonB family protein
MHVLASDPPAVLRLPRPKVLSKPEPMAAPTALAANPSKPLPTLATPTIGAAPVELNRFAEAAHVSRQANAGAVHATAFGGAETEAIAPAAAAPVQAAGFATADASTGSPGGAVGGGSIHVAGFGRALAATGGGGAAPGPLASTGFDLTSPPPSPVKAAPPAPPSYTPVKITYQPVPVYSAEGRRLGIQGEVVLSVRFQSDGHLKVARIVRGLGHGLDEAAVAAAQGIRFQPALRDGAPVEVAALIRVTFQLAN